MKNGESGRHRKNPDISLLDKVLLMTGVVNLVTAVVKLIHALMS